jgi:hypothetical protein
MATIDAYAAGLVDGEGCIYVMDSSRYGPGSISHYPVVEVGMTQKALTVLRLLQRTYGGSLYEMRKATEKWDAAWTWKVQGPKAAEALTGWLPHLTIKAEQARLAIRAEEIRQELPRAGPKRVRWTPEAQERCAEVRKRIHELNRKGPVTDPFPRPPFPGAKLVALLVGGTWVTSQGDLFSDLGWAPFSGPWPKSAFMWQQGLWTLNSSESPKDAVVSSLSDVLETRRDLSKYFLSPKAAAGILRRAAKRGRDLPPELERALSQLSRAGDGEGTG